MFFTPLINAIQLEFVRTTNEKTFHRYLFGDRTSQWRHHHIQTSFMKKHTTV